MAFVPAAKNAVRAAFAADAFVLPYHWVYDETIILGKFSSEDTIAETNTFNKYHEGKVAGDFTHYGDQTLVLLKSVAEKKTFDEQDFIAKWRALYADPKYIGYRDKATKETLANYEAGKHEGSASSDLSAAARVAPLLLVYDNEDALAKAATRQAQLTHGDPIVLAASDYFARVAFRVVRGAKPADALHAALSTVSHEETKKLIEKGLATKGQTDEEAVRSFGPVKTFGTMTVYTAKACDAVGALPSVVHILNSHESVKEAVVSNVKVGGDQAARGAIIGYILGASKPETIAQTWTLNHKDQIDAALAAF